ncbi:HYR domain-containing protein [Luteolibacter marinus]|uniref:HYR domain-containing protein n=1 Tax=Luteolibacter marinus TaxID=2776705 RepID=UPI00186886EC|nr:HYR domain-containing protein [Luteolibacter marinus]
MTLPDIPSPSPGSRARIIALAVLSTATAASAAPPAFEGLGHLSTHSSGARYAQVSGLSADGSAVAGYSQVYSGSTYLGYEAFRWTETGGMQSLGALSTDSNGYGYAITRGISADGSNVAGDSQIFSGSTYQGYEAFRWTETGGLQSLGSLSTGSAGFRFAVTSGISADGSAVAGSSYAYSGLTYQGTEAFRWTETGGMQSLGALSTRSDGYRDSHTRGISADGLIVAGDSVIFSGLAAVGREAFRWTETSGMQSLGALSTRSDGYRYAYTIGLSADGSTVAGYSEIYSGSVGKGTEAFRWTETGGMQSLGALSTRSDGFRYAIASGISADGSTVTGYSNLYSGSTYQGREVFRWTETGGLQSLGALSTGSDGFRNSIARGISADGGVVVGLSNLYSGTSVIGQKAFAWTEAGGMRNIEEILTSDFGVDLSDWELRDALSLSADGTIVAGQGIHWIDGRAYQEPWIARIGAGNSAPTLTCPAPEHEFECSCQTTDDGGPGVLAELATTVEDADGDLLTVVWKVDGVVRQTTTDVASGTHVHFSYSYPYGESTVEVSVDDGTVTESCSTIVTVVDTIAAVLVCQPPVEVNTDPGQSVATGVTLVAPEISENCEVASVTNDAPAAFPLGETIVTWTVTDIGGNVSTCEQLVTVVDREAPTMTCPPDLVVAHDPGSTRATGVVIGTPTGVADNTDPTGATVTVEALEPANYELGENEVIWTARDAAGNTLVCTQNVTVINHAPVADVPDPVTVECHDHADGTVETMVTLAAGTADADADPLAVTWLVNGESVATEESVVAGTPVTLTKHFEFGESTVELILHDGIEETRTETKVTVVDTIAPVAVASADVTVGTDDGTCEASGVVLALPTVSDNCEVVSIANDAPAVFPLGATVVTWTVTDIGGNTATCTQLVTVVDDEAPVIIGPADVTVPHDANVCEAAGIALGLPSSVSDNCGVVSVTHNAPGRFPVGTTVVVWTALDAAGNAGTATQTVTVTNAPPLADAGADVSLECDSHEGTVVRLDGTASGDPEGDDLQFLWVADSIDFDDPTSPAPSARFPLGSTRVTLTVTDGCGAMDSANVVVLIVDTESPVIQITDASHDMLWPPNHEMVPVLVRLVISDECSTPGDLLVSCTATSDEADDSTGDGNFTGDIDGQDGHGAPVPVTMGYDAETGFWEGEIPLRSERIGSGDGRKYTIRCVVADGSGNATHASVCVVVPKGSTNRKQK